MRVSCLQTIHPWMEYLSLLYHRLASEKQQDLNTLNRPGQPLVTLSLRFALPPPLLRQIQALHWRKPHLLLPCSPASKLFEILLRRLRIGMPHQPRELVDPHSSRFFMKLPPARPHTAYAVFLLVSEQGEWQARALDEIARRAILPRGSRPQRWPADHARNN
jgi:hypothetical protein